jgi:hypothetical protein
MPLPYFPPMRSTPPRLRVAALIAVAALTVHELRYTIGYGSHSGDALSEQGHAYLPFAGVAATMLLAAAAAQLLGGLLDARRTGRGGGAPPPLAVSWFFAAAALAGIYMSQELLEGLLAAGHPEGIAAAVGHGGYIAFPLAAVIGLAVALALRFAGAAVASAARRARRTRPCRAPVVRRPRPPIVSARRPVLGQHLAGRGPPIAP